MKPHRIFGLFLALLLIFPVMNPDMILGQTKVEITQTTPTVNSCSVVEGTISFASDSLAHIRLGSVNILPYIGSIATVSWKVTGTTPNFRINTYLSNYNSGDSTYWNFSQQWDTTGVYTAKPVNDTVTIKQSGLPMRFLYATIKGLTGNRKDVRIYFRVVLYKA